MRFIRNRTGKILLDRHKSRRNGIQVLVRDGKRFQNVVERNGSLSGEILRGKKIVFDFSEFRIQFVVSVCHDAPSHVFCFHV